MKAKKYWHVPPPSRVNNETMSEEPVKEPTKQDTTGGCIQLILILVSIAAGLYALTILF